MKNPFQPGAVPFVLALILLLLALVPSPEAAEPTTPGTLTRKIGRGAASSVFSLFSLKPQSKFWTESFMRTEFDDLEGSKSRDSSDKGLLNFTRAGWMEHRAPQVRWSVATGCRGGIGVTRKAGRCKRDA